MGAFSRLFQRTKQATGITPNPAGWRPTSNARNNEMQEQCRAFAKALKLFSSEAAALTQAVKSGLSTFKTVMQTPLPRAHDESPAGLLPSSRDTHLVGLNVNADTITAGCPEMQQRISRELLTPLEQWLTEYRATKVQNAICEEIRVDLDDKRRTVMALQEEYTKYKSTEHKKTDPTMVKCQKEEDKLTRLTQRYQEKEAEVFNAFVGLIRDAAMLKDFIAAALDINTNVFMTARDAFNVGPPASLPELPSPVPVLAIAYTPVPVNAGSRNSMSMSRPAMMSPGAFDSPRAANSPLSAIYKNRMAATASSSPRSVMGGGFSRTATTTATTSPAAASEVAEGTSLTPAVSGAPSVLVLGEHTTASPATIANARPPATPEVIAVRSNAPSSGNNGIVPPAPASPQADGGDAHFDKPLNRDSNPTYVAVLSFERERVQGQVPNKQPIMA